jgi:hypothetical protein
MAVATPAAPVSTWTRLAQPLPWFAALALFLVWANAAGGYFPHVWYAGGLFLGAIVLVLLVAWPGLLGALQSHTDEELAALTV